MPETYFLTVKTADGKLLVESKIIGDLFSLSYQFSRLSHLLLHQAEDIARSKMQPGSGTTPSASPSVPYTGH